MGVLGSDVSGGCKRIPKSFVLSKISSNSENTHEIWTKSLKIWANPWKSGKKVSNDIWFEKIEPNVCRQTQKHMKTLFLEVIPKSSLPHLCWGIFVGNCCTKSFRQKSFAPPKIWLLLLLPKFDWSHSQCWKIGHYLGKKLQHLRKLCSCIYILSKIMPILPSTVKLCWEYFAIILCLLWQNTHCA